MAQANERRLKESDVTWLYGPLHGETNPVPPPKVASTADRLGIDDTTGKKSILKHRTLTQMLTTPVRVETPPNDSEEAPQHLETTTLPTHPHDLMEARQVTEEPSAEEADKDESTGEAEPKKHPRDRHISFNNRVEQYIAIDDDAQAPSYDKEDDYFDELDDETEGSSSGDETLVQSPRTESRQIVAKLAPARLKTTGNFPAPSPQVVDPRGEESETSEEEPEGDAYYGDDDAQYSLSADPTPVTQDLRWDDKDGDVDDNEGEEYNSSASSNFAQSVSTVDNHRPKLAQVSDTDASCRPSHSDSADTASPNSGDTVDRGRSTQRHVHADCNEGNRIPPSNPFAEQDKAQSAGELSKSPSGLSAEHSAATVPEEPVSQSNAEQQQEPRAANESEEWKPEPTEHAEGGLVSSVFEAVNVVRDLLGTLMGSSSDHVPPSHG